MSMPRNSLLGLGMILAMSTTALAASPAAAPASVSADARLVHLFARPLVLGASVSAGFGTTSPGRRAALRLSPSADVRTVAKNGASARETLARLQDRDLEGRTLIVGIDLLFWDSTQPAAEPTLKALDRLLERAQALKIPLVLADVPELLPGRQPSRLELNRHLRSVCTRQRDCHLLSLDALLQQILRDGALVHEGRRIPLPQLVPDGLHLSEVASEFLAGRILEVAQAQ